MKKYLTTIITVAILVVAVVALVVVMAIVNGQEADSPEPTEGPVTTRKVFDVDSSKFQKIEAHYTEDYILEKQTTESGYEWKCTNHDELKIYSSAVDSVTTYLVSVYGNIIDNVDDIAKYGFSDLSKLYNIKVAYADGTSKTVYIGDMDASESYYYVYDDSFPNDVLKVAKNTTKYMLLQKEDLVNMTIFTYTSTQEPIYFIVKQDGEKVLELTFKEFLTDEQDTTTWSWTVTHPINRDCNNEAANELLNAMKSLALNGIAVESALEEDLINYGLAPASVEYYLFIKNSDGTNTLHKIRVGSKTEDGSYYYCTIDDVVDGKIDIYTISTSSIYNGVNPISFVDAYLYLKDSDLVQKVDINVQGEVHEMRYLYEKDGEETVTTRFFDGKECPDNDDYRVVITDNRLTPPTKADDDMNKDLDITNDILTANPYDCFNRLLTALYSNMILNEIELNEPDESAKGELIATIKYTEVAGDVFELKLYKRDNTTAWAYINDEYAGGYVRTTQLLGTDCIEYDYLGSLAAMKAVMKLVP